MSDTESIVVGLASIMVLGIGGQWLAWRINIPSILLLLLAGLIAGPFTGFLEPDALFGSALFPMVSLSVAIILFEGGLSLKLKELKEIGKVLRNLLTIGALITWILSALGAYFILNFELAPSLVLAAILVVTGPTVIGPLLRHIRPTGKVGSIANWEGIMIDPVGVMLAVIVFEATLAAETVGIGGISTNILMGVLKTILVGGISGAVGAYFLIFLLKRYLVPDFLQSPVTLMVVFVVFAGSNIGHAESGLLAVTLMGILLANQRSAYIAHIVEFKENLRVLIISSLFILLTARLNLDTLLSLSTSSFVFILLLMLVVRPIAVFASAYNSGLNLNEKIFLSWLAPRGIVAALIASVFSQHFGLMGDKLVAITFLVITCTVTIYGLTSGPLAKLLKLASPDSQGVIIAGAHPLSRSIANAIRALGHRVLLVDSNWDCISAARLEGLQGYYGSILSEHALDEINLGGMGKFIALTPNDEVNSLAVIQFSHIFGRSEVYRLSPEGKDSEQREKYSIKHNSGRVLFTEELTYSALDSLFNHGAIVKNTLITKEFTAENFKAEYGDSAIPLFLATENKNLIVCTADKPFTPVAGQTVISLVKPD
jgi:NhaP-type Na+/H+ or K+/H+ antiporter